MSFKRKLAMAGRAVALNESGRVSRRGHAEGVAQVAVHALRRSTPVNSLGVAGVAFEGPVRSA